MYRFLALIGFSMWSAPASAEPFNANRALTGLEQQTGLSLRPEPTPLNDTATPEWEQRAPGWAVFAVSLGLTLIIIATRTGESGTYLPEGPSSAWP